MFMCTSVEKRASVDDFETGCETHSRTILCDDCCIRSESLAGLLKAVGDRYGLEIDDVWIGAIEDGRLSFNQLECEDSSTPDDSEMAEWKLGKLKLYLCDYDFQVEKLVSQFIEMEDLAGIKTHE